MAIYKCVKWPNCDVRERAKALSLMLETIAYRNGMNEEEFKELVDFAHEQVVDNPKPRKPFWRNLFKRFAFS